MPDCKKFLLCKHTEGAKMRALGIIGILFGFFILGAALFLGNQGMFHKITFETVDIPAYTAVVKTHVGPFKDVGETLEDVKEELKEAGINTSMDIGIYYDDPETTPQEELRSVLGSIISAENAAVLSDLDEDLTVIQIPAYRAMVSTFPYKSKISILLGVMKFYPALNKHLEESGLHPEAPIVEVYDSGKKEIRYVVPLDLPYAEWEKFLQ